jgi:hypothetical protein
MAKMDGSKEKYNLASDLAFYTLIMYLTRYPRHHTMVALQMLTWIQLRQAAGRTIRMFFHVFFLSIGSSLKCSFEYHADS